MLAKTRGLAFEDLRAACPPDSPARTYTTDILGETTYPTTDCSDLAFRLPAGQGGFVYDVSKQADVCTNPSLRDQHGNFIKPELHVSMQRNRLYSVFSWSKYSASSDITIPTDYRFQWGPPNTANWAEMEDQMAWRGTLTGMYPDNLAVWNSQRHRLMSMVQDDWRTVDALVWNDTRIEYELSSMRAGPARERWLDLGVGERDWNRKNEVQKMVEQIITPASRMDKEQRSMFKMLLDVDGWGWSVRCRELLRTSR